MDNSGTKGANNAMSSTGDASVNTEMSFSEVSMSYFGCTLTLAISMSRIFVELEIPSEARGDFGGGALFTRLLVNHAVGGGHQCGGGGQRCSAELGLEGALLLSFLGS